MKINRLITILFLLYFTTYSDAQNIDSIQTELIILKEDDKLDKWMQLYLIIEAIHFRENNTELGENVCDSILLKIWREIKTKNEYDQLFLVNWYKALYQKEKGNIVSSKKYYETALKCFKFSNKKNPKNLLYIFPVLGNIYTILGDNDKAIVLHKRMIELLETNNEMVDESYYLKMALTNLAISYETKSDISKAISTIEKVFEIPNIKNENLSKVYSNYGKFLFQNKEFKKAEKQLVLAKEILINKSEIDAYDLGSVYKTLAFLEIEKNDLIKANKYFDLGISSYKKSTSNRNREIAKTYLEKSKINDNKTDILNKALSYLIPFSITENESFVPVKNQLYAENTLVDVFYEKIKILEDSEQKLKYFELIFEVQKLIRTQYLYESSKKESFKNDNEKLKNAISICYDLYLKTHDSKYPEKALEFIENAKSILLFEALLKNDISENAEEKIIFSTKKKSLIDNIINSKLKNDSALVLYYEEALLKLEFDYNISTQNDNKSQLKFRELNIKKLKANILQSNEVLIDFFDSEKSIFYVLLFKEKTLISKIDKTDLFKSNLSTFSSFFTFENRNNFDNTQALFLGDYFNKNINESTNKIYLVTDGVFNNIPFDAFRNKKGFYIEQFEIQQVFSANILQHIAYKKKGNKQVLAIAPVFKNDKSKHLKKSTIEVKNILSKIKGDKLLNEDANTSKFISIAPEYSIIHISSHAQLNQELQTASVDFYDKSLYFSQIQEEVFEAGLMVLSACETGIGMNEIGEGSMSLSRAFAYSNIPSIISSLWKVNEESSSIVFNNFYKNLSENNSISVALRMAKLDYIYNTSIADEKKLPYYWASFVFIGEDKVLDVLKPNNYEDWWIYILISLGIVFLRFVFFR